MRMLLVIVLVGCGSLAQDSQAQIPSDVPLKPDPRMTPGRLCGQPKRVRYPEKIPYCEREVDSMTKDAVFEAYKRAYKMTKYSRHQFKIDHYIPLCMGGANDPQNLWPQHLSISLITDKSEALLCKGMSLGKLKQSAAVEAIQRAKNDHGYAQKLEQQLVTQFGY